MLLRISGVINDSIVDGPGLRLAVFGQGCPHNCPGCHNPETHDYNGGYEADIDAVALTALENPLLDGVTFTGGEPFVQAEAFAALAEAIKAAVPELTVLVYTGYRWEELAQMEEAKRLLELADYLVDGRFEADKRSLELMFKGSSNQRFIDVKKSLATGAICEIH